MVKNSMQKKQRTSWIREDVDRLFRCYVAEKNCTFSSAMEEAILGLVGVTREELEKPKEKLIF